MSIGEFAGRSRLSPKALRLYDELGLLPPAQVDDSSGYRFCSSRSSAPDPSPPRAGPTPTSGVPLLAALENLL